MQLAMVGLGRMGFNMTQRLIEHGHSVVVFDLNTEAIGRAGEKGAIPSTSLAELASKLPTPRVVWVMIPSGDPTEQTINAIAEHLQPGDMIIDGGNSNYKDSMRRGEALK